MARPKDQDTAWQNRHFLTGLRVAADPLTLLPDGETAKRRDLDAVAFGQRSRNFIQHGLDESSGFVSRETDLLIYSFAEVGACNGLASHLVPLVVTEP